MIAISETTVVFKLNVQNLNEFKSQVMAYLLPLYLEKEDFIENSVYLHRKVQRLMKINYTNKTFTPYAKKENNFLNSEKKEKRNADEQERLDSLESEEDRIKKISSIIKEIQSSKKENSYKVSNIKLNSVFLKKSNSQAEITPKKKQEIRYLGMFRDMIFSRIRVSQKVFQRKK